MNEAATTPQSEPSEGPAAEINGSPEGCRNAKNSGCNFNGIVAMAFPALMFPALIMGGMTRIAANPDGILVLALVFCMLTAADYLTGKWRFGMGTSL